MITLLTAIFGKNVIPPNLRAVMLAAGVGMLSYRLMKIYQQHQTQKLLQQAQRQQVASANVVQKTANVTTGVVKAIS